MDVGRQRYVLLVRCDQLLLIVCACDALVQTVRFRWEGPQMTAQGGVSLAVPPHGRWLTALGWTVQPAASEAQYHVCPRIIIIIIIIWKISIRAQTGTLVVVLEHMRKTTSTRAEC